LASDLDLAAFVREHVRSVWALELLLALRRNGEHCWTVDELVRDLRASTSLVSANLQGFERSGLAIRDDNGCYRYAPAGPVLDDLCEALQQAYRERPVATISMIAKPGDALQSLADAFKFRGDGK
jgi:hypothetical protein